MDSNQDSQPGRLADVQFPVFGFLICSLFTLGAYYIYRTILIFDRLASSKTERNVQRGIIVISLVIIFLPKQLLNRDYLELGFILREAMYGVWFALLIHAASRLQREWGYSMDLIWTFLFQSFYLQHKANENPNGNFQPMNKRLLAVCVFTALFFRLDPPETFRVDSIEMSPPFIPGDELRIDKFKPGASFELKLSEIVVFHGKNGNDTSVGRVVGVPGQTIKVATPNGVATKERKLVLNEYYVEPLNKTLNDLLQLGEEPFGVIKDTQLEGRVHRILWNINDYTIRWDRFRLLVSPY